MPTLETLGSVNTEPSAETKPAQPVLCWVMTVAGLETYIVIPRYQADSDLLVDSFRPEPDPSGLDAVIGIMGPVSPPEMCNGLTLPIVFFDQYYSFNREALQRAVTRPQNIKAGEFNAAFAEVLDRILTVTDNAGALDEHRALNYLTVRDPGIYSRVAECYGRDLALTAVETRPWQLSTARKIVEIILTFTQRKNEFVEKYSCRVDVHEEFPFLASKGAQYYDH
jgi:hypothetical protein